MKKQMLIQNHLISLSIEDNGEYYAPQWTAAKTGEVDFSDFTDMIGFNNPLSAIKEIGRAVIDMTRGLDKPVLFIGSTDKRTRVYAKLLKSCGFAFEMVNEPIDGDLAIKLIF